MSAALQNKRSPYELVIFDWDGTLLDSAGAIVRAIQAAAVDLDIPPPDDWAARQVIGLGLADALKQAVPHLPESAYPQMVARYRHHYLSGDQALSLFEGVPEMMAVLRDQGKMLAVATGKSRLGLERALAHSGLGEFFIATRCADECHSKPHPQMLHEILDELGMQPQQAVMVGDTTHDLNMARNAGVDGVGVLYGAHPPEVLETCSPLACFGTVEALSGWLQGQGGVFSAPCKN